MSRVGAGVKLRLGLEMGLEMGLELGLELGLKLGLSISHMAFKAFHPSDGILATQVTRTLAGPFRCIHPWIFLWLLLQYVLQY